MGDQFAPFLEIGRAAKIDCMVLDRVPADEESIAARLLDRAAYFHAAASLGPPENRDGLLHAFLEFGLGARFDIDLRYFGDHIFLSPSSLSDQPTMALCQECA